MLCGALRNIFESHAARIADLVSELEQKTVIDFAGARLMPSGIVGNLNVRDAREVFGERVYKFAGGALRVIRVVLNYESCQSRKARAPSRTAR